MKIIAEGKLEADSEDGGMALIAELAPDEEAEFGMFFRVQSWDNTLLHSEFRKFEGRRVRITLEIVEDITD